jgi:glycosyltransferase involved in cell wall biosynthesis
MKVANFMSISLALATFNKDKFAADTVASAYDWVDEVIVVYVSPDKKVDDLKRLDKDGKITFHFKDNPPMFHINKQRAIELCTKDWVLQLDSDEVVSPELKKEVLATIAAYKEGDPVAYWIPRLNHFLGRPLRKGGQYPDKTIRLYKNGVAHFPCKTVHEQVDVKGPIGELTSNLMHYPYPTFRTYLEKWARYGALEGDSTEVEHFKPSFTGVISYFFIKPPIWFLKSYIRHRGYVDGFPGFVFSLFSAIRYWLEYIALYERYVEREMNSKADIL